MCLIVKLLFWAGHRTLGMPLVPPLVVWMSSFGEPAKTSKGTCMYDSLKNPKNYFQNIGKKYFFKKKIFFDPKFSKNLYFWLFLVRAPDSRNAYGSAAARGSMSSFGEPGKMSVKSPILA